MTLGPLPASDNALADDDAAASLGFAIFFDARFSADGETRCATCHPPETAFTDGQTHVVNTPTIFNSAREPVQFWDGRIAALWQQPRDAFVNEMHVDEAFVAGRIDRSYRQAYDAIFAGGSVLDNVGRALEAYMRKVASGPSRFDENLLSSEEAAGLARFFALGCDACHSGSTFGSATLVDLAGKQVKTPSLRNIARTAPYFHDGRYATLEEAVRAHDVPADGALIAFLRALDGKYPPAPWNNWPEK